MRPCRRPCHGPDTQHHWAGVGGARPCSATWARRQAHATTCTHGWLEPLGRVRGGFFAMSNKNLLPVNEALDDDDDGNDSVRQARQREQTIILGITSTRYIANCSA